MEPQSQDVRFVRIGGRVVPIRAKQGQVQNSPQPQERKKKMSYAQRGAIGGAIGGAGYFGLGVSALSRTPGNMVYQYTQNISRTKNKYKDFVKKTAKQGIYDESKIKQTTQALVPTQEKRMKRTSPIQKAKNASMLGKQYAKNMSKIGYVTAKSIPTVSRQLKPLASAGAIVTAGLSGIGYLSGKARDIIEKRKENN